MKLLHIILTVLLTIAIAFGWQQYQTAKHLAQLNERQLDSLEQISQTRYQQQADIVKRLRIQNDSLNMVLRDLELDATHYLQLISRLRLQRDTVYTKDTLYITDTDTIPQRSFMRQIDSTITLAGRFDAQPPYNLYIDSLSVYFRPQIVLAQTKTGQWRTLIDTNSPYITLRDADVQIKPHRQSFLDLKPKLWFWVGLDHSFGIDATVRVGNLFPFARLSKDSQTLGLGISLN
jgi:hypothetical protein